MDRRKLYEQLNLFVYDNRDNALRFINRLSWLFWIAGIVIITYFQGFSHQIYGYTMLLWAFWRVLDFFIITGLLLLLSILLFIFYFLRNFSVQKKMVFHQSK